MTIKMISWHDEIILCYNFTLRTGGSFGIEYFDKEVSDSGLRGGDCFEQ